MAGKYGARNSEGDHRIKDDDPLAIRTLKEEHQIFRDLFDRAEAASGDELVTIAQELCMRLAVHMAIEEEVLYPAVAPVIGEDEVNEGLVEHQAGKWLMAEIEQLNGTEPLYKSKIHVLGEETVHHIDEEDEDMFEDAKRAAAEGKLDLEAIGLKLRERQQALYQDLLKTGDIIDAPEAQFEEIEKA